MDQPIHLSAENFIKALQGKIVQDEDGKPCNFLDNNVVTIDNVVVTEIVNIKQDEVHKVSLVFSYEIWIKDVLFKKDINIDDGTFNESLQIDGGTFEGMFRVRGGVFYKPFLITEGEFESLFFLRAGVFHEGFQIFGGEFEKYFKVLGGEFQGDLKVLGGRFQTEFIIEGAEFWKTLTIGGLSEIKYLIFDLNPFNNQKIVIKKESVIKRICFKGDLPGGAKVYINAIKIEELIFENFINKGAIELTGLQAKNDTSKLRIIDSNLDNVIFKRVNFDSFITIIKGSKLNSISTIDKHFPVSKKKIGNAINDDSGKLRYNFKKMSEIYNQLYLAMQKQGYKPQEMKYYAAYLDWERKVATKEKDRSKLFSLALHKWSTNFGQSWLQGFIVSILVGLLFYAGYFGFHANKPNDWQFVENFTQFLLPTHKIDFINPKKAVGTVSAIFDIVGRIALAYMYYQTITAFRRFGRK